jgi:hypothetical protein
MQLRLRLASLVDPLAPRTASDVVGSGLVGSVVALGRRVRCVAAVVVLGCATLGGPLACKPALIPGTSVEDSEENRAVLLFLARYQAAMQERSADKVAALCAADFFEDNGNQDPKDDYNLDGLKAKLGDHLARTKQLVLEVYVQKVERDERGQVSVAYRYNERALASFPSGDKWLTATDVNKVVLRPVDNDEVGYRIVSGL